MKHFLITMALGFLQKFGMSYRIWAQLLSITTMKERFKPPVFDFTARTSINSQNIPLSTASTAIISLVN